MLELLALGLGAYYYASQMRSRAVVPEADMLGSLKPNDTDVLKAITRTRQPGVMTNIIQDQSMTGRSSAAIRNPYGPPNRLERVVNAPEVVQKQGYQTDYKRQLHSTQVKFQTFNDHYNYYLQNHSPIDTNWMLGAINNFSNGSKASHQTPLVS